MIAAVYALLCAALYYLGSRALVTQFLWSRYPPAFDRFMLCPACSGFWYGILCGGLGAWREWDFLGLPGRDPVTVLVVGLCAIIWTPIVADLQIRALASQGEADPRDQDQENKQP
jgi:hypothetical protein